jgi:hypothetical protein
VKISKFVVCCPYCCPEASLGLLVKGIFQAKCLFYLAPRAGLPRLNAVNDLGCQSILKVAIGAKGLSGAVSNRTAADAHSPYLNLKAAIAPALGPNGAMVNIVIATAISIITLITGTAS